MTNRPIIMPEADQFLAGSFESFYRTTRPRIFRAVALATAIQVGEVSTTASCEGAAGSTYCSWETKEGNLVVRVANVERPPMVTEVRLDANR